MTDTSPPENQHPLDSERRRSFDVVDDTAEDDGAFRIAPGSCSEKRRGRTASATSGGRQYTHATAKPPTRAGGFHEKKSDDKVTAKYAGKLVQSVGTPFSQRPL